MRRRSASDAAGLALEIDDEDIVLDDQHLAEMEIAVVTDVEAADIGRQQRAEAVVQGGALRQQLIDQHAIGFPHRGAALLQGVADALGAGDGFLDPELHVLGPDRFRREIGQIRSLPASARCISATRLPVCDM